MVATSLSGPTCDSIDQFISKLGAYCSSVEGTLEWIGNAAPTGTDFEQCVESCVAAVECSLIAQALGSEAETRSLLGEHFRGVDTDYKSILQVLTIGKRISQLPAPSSLLRYLLASNPVEALGFVEPLIQGCAEGLKALDEFSRTMAFFGEFDLVQWAGIGPTAGLLSTADAINKRAADAIPQCNRLVPWSLYISRRSDAIELGLDPFVELLESGKLEQTRLVDAYGYCFHASIVREIFRLRPELTRFSGLKQGQIREEFQRLDREVIRLRSQSVAAQCEGLARPPWGNNGTRVDQKSQMALLNYLIPQTRPRVPVRKLLTNAGKAVQELKPCFMMGPQAVAQFLAPGGVKFDLVLMDEASQLKPEEALGAVARGGRLVVVGDSKQLPPTSFFNRVGQIDDSQEQFTTTDAESILDICTAQFRPPRPLRWHYRSHHQSLIAFSNHYFYRSSLIVFPSPYGQSRTLGVRGVYLPDAIYDEQTNLREAQRVVDAAIEHIVASPETSLGIVTLNVKQRDLISELLDQRIATDDAALEYRERWFKEGMPLFVKNLENVQGDERDSIIISTTFGKPPGVNSVRQNFGPISRQGGWRRLNVLFTRARQTVCVYTSLKPEDIIVDSSTPEGTKALRNYLEYIRSGSLAEPEPTGRDPDSEFEIAIIDLLRRHGYEVTPQLGVAGYRIDIAVKHPDSLGSYLAAIECDGATYHSAASVRDRDRIRQDILESLGWRGRIWRIWSTDWFRSPRQEEQKLVDFLSALRSTWVPEHTSEASWIEEPLAPSDMRRDQGTVAEEREFVSKALVDAGSDPEVHVGDVVRYCDVEKPQEIISVSISRSRSDLANGIISIGTPLAQTLLGSVVGDEVQLHLPGQKPRSFRVVEVKRPSSMN